MWIQPESRFERLELQNNNGFEDQFTVEAIANLDRLYADSSVNTLFSRWNGNSSASGWNIGVTSAKSAYQPNNLIVQLVGRTFQDEPTYEVVASGLKFPLNKPVYLAVVISAKTSDGNPTSGTVTFYIQDLSDPNAKLETATVETSVVSGIQNPATKIIAGGRAASGHLWDGQIARMTISRGALTKDQLLIGDKSDQASRVLDWTFNGEDGEHPAPNTAWLRDNAAKSSGVPAKTLAAVTDFCHALFNSNEFLYLH